MNQEVLGVVSSEVLVVRSGLRGPGEARGFLLQREAHGDLEGVGSKSRVVRSGFAGAGKRMSLAVLVRVNGEASDAELSEIRRAAVSFTGMGRGTSLSSFKDVSFAVELLLGEKRLRRPASLLDNDPKELESLVSDLELPARVNWGFPFSGDARTADGGDSGVK